MTSSWRTSKRGRCFNACEGAGSERQHHCGLRTLRPVDPLTRLSLEQAIRAGTMTRVQTLDSLDKRKPFHMLWTHWAFKFQAKLRNSTIDKTSEPLIHVPRNCKTCIAVTSGRQIKAPQSAMVSHDTLNHLRQNCVSRKKTQMTRHTEMLVQPRRVIADPDAKRMGAKNYLRTDVLHTTCLC